MNFRDPQVDHKDIYESKLLIAWELPKIGGQGVNRTPDTRIFSPLLYLAASRPRYLASITSKAKWWPGGELNTRHADFQ